jgi:hypothetical protein
VLLLWEDISHAKDTRGGESIMSKDHEGDIKQYIHLVEAWYAKTSLENAEYIDEVMFGFYSPDGGTSGEIGVRWYRLGNGGRPVPCLECYDDAWHALAQLKDVIDAMAEFDDRDITPSSFCLLLDQCGFVDNTAREEEHLEP